MNRARENSDNIIFLKMQLLLVDKEGTRCYGFSMGYYVKKGEERLKI